MGKPIEAHEGSQFTQALVRSAQRIDELAKANDAGYCLLGVTPETVSLYSDRLKTYLGTVISILNNAQVSEIVLGVRGDGVKAFERTIGEEINYGDLDAKIVLRAREGKARLVIHADTRMGRQRLADFTNHFPVTEPTEWRIRNNHPEEVAEKDLTPEDLLPREESRFNRNALLEAFIFGLDKRLHTAKSESAYLETGEVTDSGLQQRIIAIDQANEILKQAIARK